MVIQINYSKTFLLRPLVLNELEDLDLLNTGLFNDRESWCSNTNTSILEAGNLNIDHVTGCRLLTEILRSPQLLYQGSTSKQAVSFSFDMRLTITFTSHFTYTTNKITTFPHNQLLSEVGTTEWEMWLATGWTTEVRFSEEAGIFIFVSRSSSNQGLPITPTHCS